MIKGRPSFRLVLSLGIILMLSLGCKSPAGPDDENGNGTGGERDVYMCGRSVMEGWFVHWGWDWNESHPVKHGRFNLYYRPIEGPWGGTTMQDSVREVVNNIPNEKYPIVFFKFCFVDFEGGSQSQAQANLNRNKNIVKEVYDIVVQQHGYKLIIGNALPMTANDTDSYLVWNHKQYNQWLVDFKNQHPGKVFIFDMYSILTDPDGNLRSDYAVDEWDSHLNEAAYNALDTPFFQLLENNF
ncbi:MAG: hypothetical protein ACE5WD_07430 [Candidatus Aminicenantia bacterium]